MKFDQAIQALKRRIPIDTSNWRDSLGLDLRVYFVVAGMKGALLSEVQREVTAAIEAGESIADFRRRFKRVTEAAGWSPPPGQSVGSRAKLIYTTNMRSAYGLGRWQQIQATRSTRPYLQWRHGGSRDFRPLHLALDRKVFRHDDPFWGLIWPPHGFGCKCTVFSLSDRDLERMALKVEVGPRLGDRLGNAVVSQEKGWGGVPTPLESATMIAADLAQGLSPDLAVKYWLDVLAYTDKRSPTIAGRLASRVPVMVQRLIQAANSEIGKEVRRLLGFGETEDLAVTVGRNFARLEGNAKDRR